VLKYTPASTFSNNEIYGGYGGIFKRGGATDGVHIYENNKFIGMSGDMYRGGFGIDNMLIIRNNTQNSGTFGIHFPYQGSYRNIIISENTFSNLLNQGVYQKFLLDGVNLNISKNTFTNLKHEGIYIDGNNYKNSAVRIQNNIFKNVSTVNSSSGITVKNVKKAIISGNQIFKTQVPTIPAASFTASPTSGKAHLTVKFTDKSTNNPTSWSWNFGDKSTSTAQNPTKSTQGQGSSLLN
jgi:PKD repeat protein